MPNQAFPAKPSPSVEQAAQITQEGLARACAGVLRELTAGRALIEKQAAEIELANRSLDLERQAKELAEQRLTLERERAELNAQQALAQRERAEKLAEAEQVQARRAEKAEARAKRLNGWLKWAAVGGFVVGVVLTR